jgi:hypothetical protein
MHIENVHLWFTRTYYLFVLVLGSDLYAFLCCSFHPTSNGEEEAKEYPEGSKLGSEIYFLLVD